MIIADLLTQIDTLYAEPENGWLDNQVVCQILSISKRTLQTFRDKGLIPSIPRSGTSAFTGRRM